MYICNVIFKIRLMEYKNIASKNEDSLLVEEPGVEYNITIPVIIPNLGGYSLEELTNKLTQFANQLIKQNISENGVKESVVKKNKYSKRLQFLRSKGKTKFSENDIVNDPRLKYLINK